MKRKVNTTIYETTDYNRFRLAEWNRKIDRAKVEKLKKSIKENGYIGSPIIVNESFEVIDGQHRLIACKEVGAMIQYVQTSGLDMDAAIALNTSQTSWTCHDYVKAYAAAGNGNYITLRNLLEKYGLGFDVTLAAITGRTIRGDKRIPQGRLIITEEQRQKAEDLLSYLLNYLPYRKNFGDFRNTMTVIIKLMKYGLIEPERMLLQMQKHYAKLQPVSKIADIVKQLNVVYNYGVKSGKILFVDEYIKREEQEKKKEKDDAS